MEKEIEYGISKYKNINSVTCYMGSILHILQQMPIFCEYITTGAFYKDLKSKDNDQIIIQLCILFRHSLENDNTVINPRTFQKTIGNINDMWLDIEHQDSQEFLNFLISTLDSELGKEVQFLPGRNFNKTKEESIQISLLKIKANKIWEKFIRNEYSPIKLLFTGLSYTQIKCEFCNSTGSSFETFSTLQLDIPKGDPNKIYSIYECLNEMIFEEVFDENNKVLCSVCSRKNKSRKYFLLWKTPKILIIQIKRFKCDMYGRLTQKITNKIDFPILDLDMSPYIADQSPFKQKCKYNLFGVNLHQEFSMYNSLNAGHYISMVKNRFNNKWYMFNDEHNLVNVTSTKLLKHKNSYLLFYYRTN